jgi:hypothetical protein
MAEADVVAELLLRRWSVHIEWDASAIPLLESWLKLVLVENSYRNPIAPFLSLLERGSFLSPVLLPVLYNGVPAFGLLEFI